MSIDSWDGEDGWAEDVAGAAVQGEEQHHTGGPAAREGRHCYV